jgi:hypothetical protein
MIAMPGSPPYALSASYRSNRLDTILVKPGAAGRRDSSGALAAADIHGANTGSAIPRPGWDEPVTGTSPPRRRWSESREPEIGF